MREKEEEWWIVWKKGGDMRGSGGRGGRNGERVGGRGRRESGG